MHAPVEEIMCQHDTDLSQPTRVVEGHREGLGLAQQRQYTLATLGITKRRERRAQGEPEVNGLLARVALLRQMREGTERLLEAPYGFPISRALQGELPGLLPIG